ncbi:MAG: FHA domain-containing protein [Acidimicrobiales bacterium]
MQAGLEVWSLSGRHHIELDRDRVTVGKDENNDVVVEDDPTISRLHAVLEPFAAGWCVTDLGSSNGTYLNGERIWGQHRVRHGDEIRVGRTRLLFRNSTDVGRTATETEQETPSITAREHEVLAVLCRPLLDRDLFTEPSSIREIADELVVSDAAVKQHVANLYAKFDIAEGVPHRRSRLANEALRRGAVTLADLRRGTQT